MNNELIGIVSSECELAGEIKDDGLSVNVTIVGTGEQGEIGKSAYQEWLDLGNVGSEGDFLLSLKGQDGYTPIKGVDYFDGEQGAKGEIGITGEQGIQGERGEKSDTGLAGSDASVTKSNVTSALGYTPANATNEHNHTNKSTIDKFTEVDNKPYYNGEEIGGAVPNLTLNELTLGGRYKITYNDIEDSLDIEVI